MKREKTARLFAGVVFLFTCAWASAAFSGLVYEKFQAVKAAVFLYGAFILLLSSFFSGLVFPPPSVSAVFLFFLIYISFSTLFSPVYAPFHYSAAVLSACGFLLPFTVKPDIKKFSVLLTLAALFSSIYGFFQLAGGVQRPYSFFGNPIFFAGFLSMALPVMLSLSLSGPRVSPLYIISFALSFIMVIACSSRGVITATLLSLGFFTLIYFHYGLNKKIRINKKIFVVTILAALSAAAFLPQLRAPVFSSISRFYSLFSASNPEIKSRVIMLKAACDMIAESPLFGSGAGSYRYYFQKYQAPLIPADSKNRFVKTSYAHNDYMQLAAEFGITGLALALAFIFAVFAVFQSNFRPRSPSFMLLGYGLFASVSTALFSSFFTFNLFIFPVSALFWITCGLLCRISLPLKNPSPHLKTGKILFYSCVAAALISIILAKPLRGPLSGFYHSGALNAPDSSIKEKLFYSSIKNDPGNFYARMGLASFYAKEGRLKQASLEYKNALNIYPFSADALFNAGAVIARHGSLEHAESYLKKALSLYPAFPEALFELGNLYMFHNMEEKGAYYLSLARKSGHSPVNKGLENRVVFFGENTYNPEKEAGAK